MWSQEQRNFLGTILVKTAKFYDKDIGLDIAKIIVDDLQDLSFESCMNALQIYRNDNKNKFWPKSSDIRAIVNPEPDSRDFATVLARKIDLAVKKYGWVWSEGYFSAEHGQPYFVGGGKSFWSWKEAVIEELGVEGWNYIQSMGGWLQVRDSANEMNEGQYIAQTRDYIQSSYRLKKQGIEVEKIQIENKNNISSLEKVDLIKLLNK